MALVVSAQNFHPMLLEILRQHVQILVRIQLLCKQQTRMLISIVSRPFMNDINNIIDHILFTNQLGDTKLQSKYCKFKQY